MTTTCLETDSVSLPAILRDLAKAQPEKRAFTFLADGEREAQRWTWGELDRRVGVLGGRLRRAVAPGERALLLFPPGLEFVEAFLGCLAAGLIAVPAYPPKKRTLRRLAAIAADAAPALVLTAASSLEGFQRICRAAPELQDARWLATDDAGDAEPAPPPQIDPASPAFLQYTSGSTAAPKGVVVSHGNLLHNEEMIRRAFKQTAESVIVGWLPFYHDMGLIGNILQPLYLGAECVLMSPMSFLQRPVRWLHAITRYRATTSGGPNFAYDLCVEKIAAEDCHELDLSSWKVAFNGAEPVRAATLRAFRERFEAWGFRPQAFYPCYGLAEGTLFVTGGEVGADARIGAYDPSALEDHRVRAAQPGSARRELVSSGRPWMDQAVVIVDPQNGRRAAADAVGEIWVRGPSVAQGYWRQDMASERDFRARLTDGTEPAGPYLRTGDLGFLAENEVYVTGRSKDLIIVRGRNLYPQDLEETSQHAHDALRPGAGAAFAVDVDGEEALVIVWELERRAKVAAMEVAAAIRRKVAEEHEVQVHEVVLIRVGTLLKTSSGKVRRAACRQAWRAGELKTVGRVAKTRAEDAAPFRPQDPADAPVSLRRAELVGKPSEEQRRWLLAALRREIARTLGVPAEGVDAEVPLTACGLDSLGSVELHQWVEHRLGVSLPWLDLLDGITLSELVEGLLEELGKLPAGEPGVDEALQERRETPAEIPLTRGQQALWFVDRLAPGSASCHVAAALRIRGPLDVPALEASFQALTDRHPALRTTFHGGGDQPVQRIRPAMVAPVTVIEVAGPESEIFGRLDSEAYRPFDPENGPLWRVVLLRQAVGEAFLVLAIHHMLTDFWSLTVLMAELRELYLEKTGGAPADLPALGEAYSDHVIRQEKMLAGPEGERMWSYWRARLAGELPQVELPADRPRPPRRKFLGAAQAGRLPVATTAQLDALSRSRAITLFTLLAAGFQVLLSRLTGLEELLVGSPTANRARQQTQRVLGYFVNPVVLRGDLSGRPSFDGFLERTRRVVLEALKHQEFPFAVLAERLEPVRDPARSPIVQVMFIWQRAQLPGERALAGFALGEEGARMPLGELELSSVPLEHRPAQFDLTLSMARVGDELGFSLQYDRDLFDASTIRRMAEHLTTLLCDVAAHPERRIDELELLSPAQCHQLTLGFQDLGERPGGEMLLGKLMVDRARRQSTSPAVFFEDREMSYGELERRTFRLALALRELGVGPETPVGLLVERSAEMVVGLWGILRAGGGYLPLDPAYPAERTRGMLEDSGASVVLTQTHLRERVPRRGGDAVLCLDALDSDALVSDALVSDAEESEVAGCLPAAGTPAQMAYMIYTSGSTGRPKGVPISHANVLHLFASLDRRIGCGPRDVVLALTSMAFDVSVVELLWALCRGARVVILGEQAAVPSPSRSRSASHRPRPADFSLRSQAERHRPTLMQSTPSVMATLMADARTVGALRGLDTLVLAGEALPADLADEVRRQLGCTLINGYGPTEATVYAATHRVVGKSSTVPIGRTLANASVGILDRHFRLAPLGSNGELVIGGEGVARGYHARPALSAERFCPDPWGQRPGERLYRTGDLARFRPDGTLEFLGRLDHQVKLRGLRIELGEIETVLRGHPKIRETVVAAPAGPGGDRQLVAYAVATDGDLPPVDELRGYLRETLPEFAVPSVFVPLSALPRTPSGKIDRRALPRPERSRPELRAELRAPSTVTEEKIAGVWREILELDKVGVDDNFFDLGGHSLQLPRVHQRLQDVFSRELDMVRLLEHPTIAALARHLDQGQDEPRASRQRSQDRAARQKRSLHQFRRGNR